MPDDLLDEIFKRIYRFNNQMPRDNYSEIYKEMKQVAVVDVGIDDKEIKYAYDYSES